MKMPDNTLRSVKEYFTQQLAVKYDEREVEQFYFMAVRHFLGWEKFELRMRENERCSESQLLSFIYCVKDLKKDKPIQYILGEAYFYDMDLKVDNSVLIPRPETEELVEWIVEDADDKSLKILDIGTGSGAIALALKKNLKQAHVSAMDVSEKALNTARYNAKQQQVEIEFLLKDILQYPDLEASWDIVVSNPPYIAREESKEMRENVLQYEPHLALFVDDEDVLLFYKVIANWSISRLSECGAVYFEINEAFGHVMVDYFESEGWQTQLRKDIHGKSRMLKLWR